MRTIIRGLDRFSRRVQGIYEFTDEPGCLFRLRQIHARRALILDGTIIPAGAALLELHIWNEHVPLLPEEGPDFTWAVQSHRMMVETFRLLARLVQTDPGLAEIEAIGGATVWLWPRNKPGSDGGLMKHLGFTILPYRSRLGRFGEFWENLFTWLLMWTFNQGSLRTRHLFGLRRTEVWMPRSVLIKRYG